MDATLDAIVEIFAWTGFGLGAVIAGIALVLFLLDGTWVPVRAVVEEEGGRRLVRWFDEQGEPNEAPLAPDQHPGLHAGEMVDLYARRGWRDRMRTTPGSPVVRGARNLATGLVALGAASLILSWVLLFVRG
jgi:hypothetical protein